MSTKLITQNAEHLTYDGGVLNISVLGGIRLDGLDRMRVTLKVALNGSPRPPVRHNLDLYNDSQTEKLIRKVAEKLEIGTSVIEATIAQLTEKLEQYRIEESQRAAESQVKTKILTPEEREEAESFLKTKELMEATNEMIGKEGMVGEQENRLLMYLIFTSRKMNTPLHIVSLGASGTGKTHLQEKVGELIPEEDTLSVTCLSENSFYYFGRSELKNKLILIEDLDGTENALYPLRELQSKKRISKTIAHKNTKGETRTIHLVVEGPVSVSGCTTREQIYEDNANRSFLIYLDESAEQTEKIMAYQRALSAGSVDTEAEEKAAELLRNTQRILKPVRVINPFAEKLIIPNEVLKPRRTNNHYLQFIEAVTYYHQYQRKWINIQTGEIIYDPQVEQSEIPIGALAEHREEIYIETTLEDIAWANKLLKTTLLRKSDELTGACRNYLERLKLYLQKEKRKSFTNRELSNATKTPLTTIKRHHLDLYNSGYLRVIKKDKLKGYEYEIVSYAEYKKLQEGINKVLDDTLEKLVKQKQPSSPVAAQ